MSYRCQICRSRIGPHKCQHRVVVEKRDREYHDGDKVTHGWEIVRELVVCDNCTGKR